MFANEKRAEIAQSLPTYCRDIILTMNFELTYRKNGVSISYR